MPTVQIDIVNTDDDVQEAVGIALDNSSVVCGFNSGFGVAFAGGVRFRSVGVPQGATINSATITFQIDNVTGTPNTTIYGIDVDDVAVWSDPGNLPSAATKTTASATGPTATGSQQVNVASIVQEIVDRAGWASGNDMAFAGIDNAGSGDNFWVAEDLADAGGNEARLDIDYTAGGPTFTPRRALTGVGF